MAEESFFKKIISGEAIAELFQKKGKSVVGIDLGSSAIKVVQLRKEKERAVLETYGELSVGHYSNVDIGRAAILSEDKLVEMLKDIVKESGIKAKDAVLSIPLKSSFVTTVTLPGMTDKELEEAIPYEARRHIPVPINEVEMDWWVLPKKPESEEEAGFAAEKSKKEMSQVLLVAIHKNVIEQNRAIIEKAGLRPKALEIEVFSTARSSIGRELVPILLVDLGASFTKMTIVDYGIVRVTHNVDRGGQDISSILSQSMSIDFARAEKLKREVGLSDRPEHREMVEVIKPTLDFIFSEAARLAAEYRMRQGRSVSRVILTGGGALLGGITDFVVNKFGVEVNLANPFSKLEYPAFLEPALREVGPNFSTAIGLALREIR